MRKSRTLNRPLVGPQGKTTRRRRIGKGKRGVEIQRGGENARKEDEPEKTEAKDEPCVDAQRSCIYSTREEVVEEEKRKEMKREKGRHMCEGCRGIEGTSRVKGRRRGLGERKRRSRSSPGLCSLEVARTSV